MIVLPLASLLMTPAQRISVDTDITSFAIKSRTSVTD
jgi:hypothetical protein